MNKLKERLTKPRKGFTLIECIACAVILALVTIAMGAVSTQISTMRLMARNDVFLTTHNLNCMERLRQMSYDLLPGEELLSHYGNDEFGTTEVQTEIVLETSILGKYRVYVVTVNSRMINYTQYLTSTYVLTNMGGPRLLDHDSDSDDVLNPDAPIE